MFFVYTWKKHLHFTVKELSTGIYWYIAIHLMGTRKITYSIQTYSPESETKPTPKYVALQVPPVWLYLS